MKGVLKIQNLTLQQIRVTILFHKLKVECTANFLEELKRPKLHATDESNNDVAYIIDLKVKFTSGI